MVRHSKSQSGSSIIRRAASKINPWPLTRSKASPRKETYVVSREPSIATNTMPSATLLDLPNELLQQLPQHMRNLEDFMNFSCSCRRLHSVLTKTPPKTILQLASRTAPAFFRPDPFFLALATARQIAKWTLNEPDTRTKQLIEAFRGGVQGLVLLAERDDVVGVGLSMDDIRRICAKRFSVINPLNETIDAMIGNTWYSNPNFWDGGVDDAFTLHADVDSGTMQLLMYGELFGSSMESFLTPNAHLPRFDIDTRIEFIKYCIPDWTCTPTHGRSDDFEVLPVGPFAPTKDKEEASRPPVEGNQTALAHLLGGAMFNGTLWKKAWRRVLVAAGCFDDAEGWPDDWQARIRKMDPDRAKAEETDTANTEEQADEDSEDDGDDDDNDNDEESIPWQFKIFWDTLTQLGGLEGMTMVAQFKGVEKGRDVIMKPEWKARIIETRDQALALEDKDRPSTKVFGSRRKKQVSEAPDFAAELYVCCAGMWGGL